MNDYEEVIYKLDILNKKHDIFNGKLDNLNEQIGVLFKLNDIYFKEILRKLAEFEDDEE